MTMGDPILS